MQSLARISFSLADDTAMVGYSSSGTGPAVVFVHGALGSGSMFERQLCGPLGKQLHAVAFDFPGHGGSANANDPAVSETQAGGRVVSQPIATDVGSRLTHPCLTPRTIHCVGFPSAL